MSERLPDGTLTRADGIELRTPGASDLGAVAAIEEASFGDPWSAREFASVLSIDHSIFLIAESRGEIVGYVIAIAVLDEAEILNVAVSPSRRGEGIGGDLLDAAVKQVESRGAESLFLEVRVSNVAARALYQSRGFAEISKRKNYYRTPLEDALVMRRAAKR
ncbi:MAG: ribosomal protein S18-alanine N-acetyltransferase [Gemmatimonadaceae bacterium]